MRTFILLTAMMPSALSAQLSLSSVGTTYTITFDATLSGVNLGTFDGTGFEASPATGRLDSDAWASTGMSDGNLAFGGTATTGDYARGTSPGGTGTTTEGFYSFDVDGTSGVNRALGVLPGVSDWSPGTITIRILNATGTMLGDIDISYEIHVNNVSSRSSSFNFSYSTDNSTYTNVTALDYTSPTTSDGNGWVQVDRTTSITGLSLANSAYLYLRWYGDDVGGTGGGRDQFGLDDIQVSSPSLLPVQWTSFDVASVDGQVLLEWSVNTGSGFSHFIVQRSRDGRTFDAIGVVDDANGGTFSFTDAHAPRGLNYYRVETIGLDGSRSYSEIRQVSVSSALTSAVVIGDQLVVSGTAPGEVGYVELVDLTGRIVRRQTFAGESPNVLVPLDGIGQGQYLVRVLSPSRNEALPVFRF